MAETHGPENSTGTRRKVLQGRLQPLRHIYCPALPIVHTALTKGATSGCSQKSDGISRKAVLPSVAATRATISRSGWCAVRMYTAAKWGATGAAVGNGDDWRGKSGKVTLCNGKHAVTWSQA